MGPFTVNIYREFWNTFHLLVRSHRFSDSTYRILVERGVGWNNVAKSSVMQIAVWIMAEYEYQWNMIIQMHCSGLITVGLVKDCLNCILWKLWNTVLSYRAYKNALAERVSLSWSENALAELTELFSSTLLRRKLSCRKIGVEIYMRNETRAFECHNVWV